MAAVATSSDEALGAWQVIEWFKEEKEGKNFSNQAYAQANSQSFVVIEG